MKRLHTLLLITFSLFFVVTSCSDKKEDLPIISNKKESINPISQFVYDGLSNYYLWSAEMVNKKPAESDNDPEVYFYNTLYKTDTDNGWSWITDDVQALLSDFAGESKSFGYSIGSFNQIDDKIYAFIRYVFDNTPASDAGMERLDLIGEIDGKPITANSEGYISDRDVDILYGGSTATFTTYRFTDDGIAKHKEVEVAPIVAKTNPVLYDTVYTIGDKKVGYLFYTNFIGNYNSQLFEVFSKFKNEAVTDLVLDLRYNPGGGLDAASYLVSLYAPEADVKNKTVLTTLTYNKYVNSIYDKNKWNRSSKLGEYNKKEEQNPLEANIDLDKVYVIATNKSASASELITFCSRAIMGEANVVHIGGKTSGKYTASWTIHPYDDDLGQPIYEAKKLSASQKNIFKNWAMQPIVAVYTDKDGKDFIDPGYLNPNYPLEEGFGNIANWKPIGDEEDVFLGQALYLITGDESYKPVEPTATRSSQKQMIELKSGRDDAKPLLLNDVRLTPEDFKRIKEMREQENKKE